MSDAAEGAAPSRAAFERRLGELRPKLHRYCARMTGSAIDGDDIVQEVLVKAIEALAQGQTVANLEGWLFRIAHNAALDFLRRRTRLQLVHAEGDTDMIADASTTVANHEFADTSLRTFMRLPASQRAAVVLMDVLGYTLEEICAITNATLPAVKAALNRGRTRLRDLAVEPDDQPAPKLTEVERARLTAYVARFNARDFDAIRDMLAEDVRLDLVGRTRMIGKREVGRYFTNYSAARDWQFVAGMVDRHPALIVRDPGDPGGRSKYFVVLDWTGTKIANIRDFRHAKYALEGAEIVVLES